MRLVKEPDLYAVLKASGQLDEDPRWKTLVTECFTHEYVPHDVSATRTVLREFAEQHGFELCERSSNLARLVRLRDVLQFYTTLTKLALQQPKKLLALLPDVEEVPNSLGAIEGLFALRAAILAGNMSIFFREWAALSPTERLCLRGRRYDLVLFQADNIVLASSKSHEEIRRDLDSLVSECPVCLDPLTDERNGLVCYPFKCMHALHSQCAKDSGVSKGPDKPACPVCRVEHRPKKSAKFTLLAPSTEQE
jgi:hypothetical protein